jgi:DNA-directed RNA polymerase specialized sigma24 family protein
MQITNAYKQYNKKLIQFARKYVKNIEDAQDIVANV